MKMNHDCITLRNGFYCSLINLQICYLSLRYKFIKSTHENRAEFFFVKKYVSIIIPRRFMSYQFY